MSLSTLDNPSAITLDPINRLELIKYAAASGDFNPIHLIDDEAKEAGLPGIIAHGMFNMARVARVFSPFLEKGYIKSFSTRFTGMVFLDDVLTIIPRLKSKEGLNYKYSVEVNNQQNKTVLKCEVIFTLHSRDN